MIKKQKRWSQMNTEELAAATHEFDRPDFEPTVRKPTKARLAELHRVQRRSAANRFRIALLLEKKLVEQTDDYAANHGVTFSEVVADALRRFMGKKSA
jgi:hypothetical protein